ncbi:hypothetical protein ACOSQ3_031327 [Xanthoceras sorbifolium]
MLQWWKKKIVRRRKKKIQRWKKKTTSLLQRKKKMRRRKKQEDLKKNLSRTTIEGKIVDNKRRRKKNLKKYLKQQLTFLCGVLDKSQPKPYPAIMGCPHCPGSSPAREYEGEHIQFKSHGCARLCGSYMTWESLHFPKGQMKDAALRMVINGPQFD